jgi:glucose-1-phosphate adenylyltransferase
VSAPAPNDTIAAGPDGLVAVLLAGGKGTRLGPLTQTEAKPAVPFAEGRLIVDFAMYNAYRSNISSMLVCTQWHPETLVAHLECNWRPGFSRGLVYRDGNRLAAPDGYLGTAHAVACNASELEAAGTRELLVLAGDHVYDMDYRKMITAHRAVGLPVTVATLPVPRSEASDFGVFETEGPCHARRFLEKPTEPPAMYEDPDRALISMGIYVFDWLWLRQVLGCDSPDNAKRPLDFGHDVLPAAVTRGEVSVYCFMEPAAGLAPYWRDVGTLSALEHTRADFSAETRPFDLPVFPVGCRQAG